MGTTPSPTSSFVSSSALPPPRPQPSSILVTRDTYTPSGTRGQHFCPFLPVCCYPPHIHTPPFVPPAIPRARILRQNHKYSSAANRTRSRIRNTTPRGRPRPKYKYFTFLEESKQNRQHHKEPSKHSFTSNPRCVPQLSSLSSVLPSPLPRQLSTRLCTRRPTLPTSSLISCTLP